MIRMANKSALSLQGALLELILYYRGHLKVVLTISADHESTILACESYVNSQGATLRSRIPGEHEVDAERGMRTVRESMRVKISRQTIRSLMPSFHGSRWIAPTPGTLSLTRVRPHGCPKRLSRVPRSTFGRTSQRALDNWYWLRPTTFPQTESQSRNKSTLLHSAES
jgi:hypothetical protein